MPKISESRRAEVRARILEAAQHLVARRGIEGTSMNAIVRASGLSKGAIYGHFPSKADLVVALQDRVLANRVKVITARFQTGDSARERILKLLRLQFAEDGPSNREGTRLRLQFTASALKSPSLRAQVDARYERVHGLFRDLFKEGMSSGEFRKDIDPDASATTIIGLLDGLTVDWAFTSRGRFDWDRLLPALERLLFFGFLNPEKLPNSGPSFPTQRHRRTNLADSLVAPNPPEEQS